MRISGTKAKFFLLLAALITTVAMSQTNQYIPGYEMCVPEKCNSKNHCHCASSSPPGGLPAKSIPQFVVVTNDDAITVVTMPVILDIVDKHRMKNGCKPPVTWFVSINYTDPHLVQEVYMKGHEIATHTLNHVMNPDVTEIVGAKLWLNSTARIPLEKIKGFRAPFLAHSAEQRYILSQNGFLYDSSIPEPFPTPTSPSGEARVFPYSMDFGIPQNCALGTAPCLANETYPGLWEFPLYNVQDANGKVITNMDPPGDIFEAYAREFDRSYYGNRAPVGVFIHAAWLMDPARADGLSRFIEYALSHDDVYFGTMTQVINWIKNPKTADEYKPTCKPPTDIYFPSGSFCKAVSCVNGNWSDVSCSCTCAAEFLPNQPGFCIDSYTKACTVAKVWNENVREFECPGEKRAPPKEDAAPSTDYGNEVPQCGHDLMPFVGLAISGTADNAVRYTEAIKAVDGMCTSCAVADSPTGNFFIITLQDSVEISGVYVVTKNDVNNAYIFVGDSPVNSGMGNALCVGNAKMVGGKASMVSCEMTGKYVTFATPSQFELCDIYVITAAQGAAGEMSLSAWGQTKPQDSAAYNPAWNEFQTSTYESSTASPSGSNMVNGADMAQEGDFNEATQSLIDAALSAAGK